MGLTDRRRAIVLFGDSLTQRSFEPTGGWGARLAHMYGRRCDVYNRGYGGYNTRWCRSQLPHLFPLAKNGPIPNAEHPLLVTIMLGTNDAAIAEVVPTATIPLDEYGANLLATVRHVQRAAKYVVVMTPPCMDEAQRLRFQLETHGKNAIGKLDRTNQNTAGAGGLYNKFNDNTFNAMQLTLSACKRAWFGDATLVKLLHAVQLTLSA
jgi:lysophospholipase L1-like esterase